MHLWEPGKGYASLWVQQDSNPWRAFSGYCRETMERESSHIDECHNGGTEAIRQDLTPTKVFSKKRVTAGAHLAGALHTSPQVSMVQWKCNDVPNETEYDPTATESGRPVSREAGNTPHDFPKSAGTGWQVTLAAELAGVCRQACEESRKELEAHAQSLAEGIQADSDSECTRKGSTD